MMGQRTPEKNTAWKWFKPPQWGHLFLRAQFCLFTQTVFPLNKHFTCFNPFCFFVEIHFYKATEPGPCHWPLVYWLGFNPFTAIAWLHNTGVGSLFLLQGIFPTQGLHPCLPHCRWILYQLSHKGNVVANTREAWAYYFCMAFQVRRSVYFPR